MKACLLMNFVLALCWAILAKTASATEEGVIEGQYIVVFKSRGMKIDSKNLLSQIQAKGRRTVALVEADEALVAELERNTAVESIEVNRIISLEETGNSRVAAESLPNSRGSRFKKSVTASGICHERPSYEEDHAWGSIRTSYRERPDYFTKSYHYMYRGAGVDVYVLDTGIDIHHDEFDGRASYGMIGPTIKDGPIDFFGHGTHVAGTVAGRLLGMADRANVISCKVLDANGRGTTWDLIYAVDWVVQQVQTQWKPRAIINMSLRNLWPSRAFYQAIQGAVDEGIPVIVAAGNDAQDARTAYPAAHDNTITVAASDKYDNFASFSNYGSSVDIVAPGVDIWSAGSSNDRRCSEQSHNECILPKSGTSMAAPHVSGMVARHLSSLSDNEFKKMTPQSILDTLEETAVQDHISFQSRAQSQTPNLLLFKECKKTSLPTTKPAPTKPTTINREIYWKIITTSSTNIEYAPPIYSDALSVQGQSFGLIILYVITFSLNAGIY